MQGFTSGYVPVPTPPEIAVISSLSSGLPVQAYLGGGMLSGWTSGFLSGYWPTAVSTTMISGRLSLALSPMVERWEHLQVLNLYYEAGMGRPITIWAFPAGSEVAGDSSGVCQWLFRRR